MSTDTPDIFDDLSRIRDQDPRSGGLPLSLLKHIDDNKVVVQFYEPDPLSSRTDYYYNARENVLYKRKKINNTKAVWDSVVTI